MNTKKFLLEEKDIPTAWYNIVADMENKPMPIDVYDAAAWMAVTALSEASIAAGGAPQAYPDFTDGKWLLREPEDVLPLK